MLVVDTNVLVYASDGNSPFHAACRVWLENRRVRADDFEIGRFVLADQGSFAPVVVH